MSALGSRCRAWSQAELRAFERAAPLSSKTEEQLTPSDATKASRENSSARAQARQTTTAPSLPEHASENWSTSTSEKPHDFSRERLFGHYGYRTVRATDGGKCRRDKTEAQSTRAGRFSSWGFEGAPLRSR